ncbi:MAG: radical SAM protein [Firmicutes bacterium]|nr:radical SAM protein [Bacillota bacterium]MCL5039895.1 radical SAM protein [Bacillota bacterium]
MSGRIDRLYITLTRRCNMSCPHCWVSAGPMACDGDKLSPAEIIGAIRELQAQGLTRVKITGGEPLVRREVVFEVMSYCDEHGIGVSLETNASLIDDECLRFFSTIRDLEIGVSLDYSTPEAFDSFRGMRGAFDRVLYAFKHLNGRTKIGTVSIVFANNFDLMPMIARLVVEELGGSVKFGLCTDMGRAQSLNRGALLSVERIPEYFDRVHLLASKYPSQIRTVLPMAFFRPSSPLKIGVCAPDQLLGLLPNGDVSLCGIGVTNAGAIFGNIRATSLREIISTSRALRYLQAIQEVRPEGVCGQCIFETCCGHTCPAWSFEAYGTFNGPFPVCQELYEAGLFPEQYLKGA